MAQKKIPASFGRFDTTYGRLAILLIGLIVVVLVTLLVNLVVQGFGNSERKLAGALINTLKQDHVNAKATLGQQAQTSTFDATATFNMNKLQAYKAHLDVSATIQDASVKLPVDVVGDLKAKTTYLKVSDSKAAVDSLATVLGGFKEDLAAIVDKTDNKWVHLVQGSSAANDCTSSIFEKISKDQSAAGQLTDAYIGNRFLKVTDEKEESTTRQVYTVNVDQAALTGFVRSVKTKDFFKQLSSCSQSYDPIGTEAAAQQPAATAAQKAADPTNETKIVVENNRIAKVTNVQKAAQQTASLQVEMTYDDQGQIVRPVSDIIEFDSIKQEVSSFATKLQQAQQSSTSGAGSQLSPVSQ